MVIEAHTIKFTEIFAAVFGAFAGLLLQERQGIPVWFILITITISLAFGMRSAAMRSPDPNVREEQTRVAKANAGALWIVTCGSVWQADLALPGAMMLALGMGLLGTRGLKMVENKWLNFIGMERKKP